MSLFRRNANEAAGRALLSKPPLRTPQSTFWYDIAWILILVAVAIAYSAQPAWTWIPHSALSFENVVPLWVPWAGALGGVTISLVGVARHTTHWDYARYGYWHLTRPFLGLVSGTIAVLIVVLVLNTVTPPTTGDSYTPAGVGVLTVIAFVVGFREETFRDLVTKVVDVILSPGQPTTTSSVALIPSVVEFGSVTDDTPVERTANLFNGGVDTIHISASGITVEGSSAVVVAFSETDLSPEASMPIGLTWTPAGKGTVQGTLVVTTEARRLTALLKGVRS